MRRVRSIHVIWLLLISAAAAGAIGWWVVRRGISAKDEPGPVETFVARRLRHLAIPADAVSTRNPVQLSPEVLSRAKVHFADHCALCHGNDGRGATLVGRGLYPKPPDMTQPETQQLTDGELYFIIEDGVRFTGMPAFGEELGNTQAEESWDLVHFIRLLPSMTPDEVVEMQKMNPKSPEALAKEERMRKFLAGEETPPEENSHEHHH
jgi:mono/diheme cytochrome c family protein